MSDSLLPAAESAWVSERARALRFDGCGVAPAEKFPELSRYSEWIERGYAGEMNYLKDPRRLDPRTPMPELRSIIVCALNYNSGRPYSTEANSAPQDAHTPGGWISRYAWGDDYHEILWEKLNELSAAMRGHFAETFELRAYADTGPIHERAAAKYAGLGWLGKNTLLINQSLGSWLFLGVMMTSLPLPPTLGPSDAPPADRCGTCRRCLDVCPWNRKSPRTELVEFQPRRFAAGESESEPDSLYLPDLLKIANLSREKFQETFRGSPVKRTKWQGLIRNACIALGNAPITPGTAFHREVENTLKQLCQSDDSVISESARWALLRIQ